MSNYFDYLPNELIVIIMKFMKLHDKEHFTKAYPEYYELFRDRKRRFLEENYQINYRPLVKKGIDVYVKENKLCIYAMLRKKRFYVDCFPESLRCFFVNYDTPLIPYRCSFRSRNSDIFHCKSEDLKYKISMGKYPAVFDSVAKKFIFLKTKTDTVISIWEREAYGGWCCYFNGLVHVIIGRYYVNFKLLEKIVELL